MSDVVTVIKIFSAFYWYWNVIGTVYFRRLICQMQLEGSKIQQLIIKFDVKKSVDFYASLTFTYAHHLWKYKIRSIIITCLSIYTLAHLLIIHKLLIKQFQNSTKKKLPSSINLSNCHAFSLKWFLFFSHVNTCTKS